MLGDMARTKPKVSTRKQNKSDSNHSLVLRLCLTRDCSDS